MNTSHTPGPWKWVGTKGNPKLAAYLRSHDGKIVGSSLDGFVENKADARLIAQAPALLSALQQLLAVTDSICPDNAATLAQLNEAERAAREAVRLATSVTKSS